MEANEPVLGKDDHDFPVIFVGRKHLEDFPRLVQWIRDKGHGRDTGVVKLRLFEKDRQDDHCISELMDLLKKTFEGVEYDFSEHTHVPIYEPDAQQFFKACENEDIYEYVRLDCTSEEREDFVKEAVNPASYENIGRNCCSHVLFEHGLDGLRKHLFEVIRKSAPFNQQMEEKMRQADRVINQVEATTINVYGSEIQLDRQSAIKICGKFSLSHLNTILDLVEDKYDGIAYPHAYVGTPHSTFTWHIEDAGLFSINYLFKGAGKLWFCIPPQFYGLVDKIAASLSINRGHAACRAILVNHKALMVDPEFFKTKYGIPFSTVLQEPGDFIVTLPFVLNAGFCMGRSLAMASNFADVDWIELGLYAPICGCIKEQAQIDFTPILRNWKPHLLDMYQNSAALVFPSGHPMEVLHITSTDKSCTKNQKCSQKTSMKQEQKPGENSKTSQSVLVKTIKARTLYCPSCNQSFKENKLSRLTCHIKKKHHEEEVDLMRIVTTKYPPWKPKMNQGFKCSLCFAFIRGSKTHIYLHHQKCHGEFPFKL